MLMKEYELIYKNTDDRKICEMYILKATGIHLQHSPGPGSTCIWF